jgi:hypothetical protein
MNALYFVITFTNIIIIYLLFFDWQELRERLFPSPINLFTGIPVLWLKGITLGLAVLLSILWNANNGIRNLINFREWLNWHGIFYFVLPLAIIWFFINVSKIIHSLTIMTKTKVKKR